jgi:hypothetical protein
VQKTTLSLFDISKWLWPRSSKKTVGGPVMSKLDLKQQDSLVQFKLTESLEFVFSGASCFSAVQLQPPLISHFDTAKEMYQKISADVQGVNLQFDRIYSQSLGRILILRGNLIN